MFVTNTSISAIYSLINLTDTTMNDQDKLVTLHTYSNNVDASIARDVLENAGISCMLTNETFSGIYPIGHTSLGGIQLLVFEKDEENARNILSNTDNQ